MQSHPCRPPSHRSFHLAVVLVFGALAFVRAAWAAASPEIGRAIAQFREFYLETAAPYEMRDTNELSPEPARALEFARTLRADGTWADIDYASTARSSWPQATHYARMAAMVTRAERPGTAGPERQALLDATHRAFANWIAHDYQCPNWWYNEIGTPKTIGVVALLLGDQLTPDEYRYVAEVSLGRYKIRMTGQNKVWLAGNALMRGMLVGDRELIRTAADTIWAEIEVTTKEGIQPDYSFHQHGPQQQFGNYGMAFAVDEALWARVLRGTPWRMPPAKLAIFRDYLLLGQNWISWRGVMDISSCGRQLMPHSPAEKAANIARVMEQAAVFDEPSASAYRAFVARNQRAAANDLVGTRYFWRSDYLVHRGASVATTLKMSSRRVIGAELVNSENLRGYHLGDGALYLYRDGGEYQDIFPVWDWRKVPGVTCSQVPPPSYSTSGVETDFVGGVSDDSDAVCALDYDRDGVRARKAWFFTGDTVVCLGAGINGAVEAGIATTVNQCLLRGAVQIDQAVPVQSGNATESGDRALSPNSIVTHDGWTYELFGGGEPHLRDGAATGNWHRVFNNPAAPAADVTQQVFTLWIDHGRAATNGTYGYAVSPVGARATYQVIENSAGRQVVRLSPTKTGIVFWAASEVLIPGGARIAVDAPCLVLLEGAKARVVDPTQKLKSAQVTRDGVERVAEFPTGGRAGTAVVVSW